jgi:MOSC domain-containing protein YiiM
MASEARILQINISRGGVPKKPVQEANVTLMGIDGDGHAQSMHGGPNAALCLFGYEVIQRIRKEGHPIYPGSTGENITVKGMDWPTLKPGMRLKLGDEVEIELTQYTKPCGTIEGSFKGGKFSRIAAQIFPGECRLYAKVLKEGRIRPGDEVAVLAPVASAG